MTLTRYLRFSLRTLMLFVLCCAIPLAWFSVKMRQAQRQAEFVTAIFDNGGYVVYDDLPNRMMYHFEPPRLPPPQPRGTRWLREQLGDDFFSNVEKVYWGSDSNPPSWEWLQELPELRGLDLTTTRVTDGDLPQIIKLSRLRKLWLNQTAISDAGLQQLQTMQGLESLFLIETHATEAGIQALQQALPNCKIYH